MWRQSANHSLSLRWAEKTAPWEFQTKLLHYFFTSNNTSNLHLMALLGKYTFTIDSAVLWLVWPMWRAFARCESETALATNFCLQLLWQICWPSVKDFPNPFNCRPVVITKDIVVCLLQINVLIGFRIGVVHDNCQHSSKRQLQCIICHWITLIRCRLRSLTGQHEV